MNYATFAARTVVRRLIQPGAPLLIASLLTAALSPSGQAKPAFSLGTELTQDTQRLADIVREGAEVEGGPSSAPILLATQCDLTRQWWYQRCDAQEALVPFFTGGPGSAVWNYVALFRILPPEGAFERDSRVFSHRPLKHVALVTFAFIPEPLGLPDWTGARIEDGHVVVPTRHWAEGGGHANPSKPGTIRIDLDGGLRLSNLP